MVDKENNVYFLMGGVYSNFLYILNKGIEYQGIFHFSYLEYSSVIFSISPDGVLYTGSGKALYKIDSSE